MKSDSSTSSSSNGSSISNKSLNSQQHPLLFSPTQGPGPRAVIPSKRAAQNRAAQRAFRQRKERYVKDLEKKAKLMDEWKTELDQLRQQNKELRETTMRLEKQIHQQQQQQQYNTGDKLISPITSPAMSAEIVPAPVVVVMENQKSTRRRIKQEESPHKIQTNFLPVNLRAPDQTSYGSPTTSCSSSSSIGGLEDQTNYNNQISWPTTSGADFDPYETNLDFISNGGQVLDDLCAVLQTRQRPEINSSYAMQNQQQNYVMSLNSAVVRSDTNNMLMSRTY